MKGLGVYFPLSLRVPGGHTGTKEIRENGLPETVVHSKSPHRLRLIPLLYPHSPAFFPFVIKTSVLS